MRHLDNDIEVAMSRLRGVLQNKTLKFGFFNNDGVEFEQTGLISSYTVHENCSDGMYSNTGSNIALDIVYTKAVTNMVNQPECPKLMMHLLVLPTSADCTLPEMVEVKVFGSWGKPSTVAIDKDDGTVYLMYILDNEIHLKQFGVLSESDKEFITSDMHTVTFYEFGFFKLALYRFITREYGWKNLRDNLYIQFNLSPIIRLQVGAKPDKK